MLYRLTLEYDGTHFHGSQAQAAARGRTVQGELEGALARLTGGAVRVALAGRTDAGVHALGQVASFALDRAWEPATLRRALNAVLPPDLAVRAATPAPDGFHARFSARGRAYRYLIRQGPVRAPLLRDRTWHVHATLDVPAMDAAARVLLGRHDFAAFAGSGLGVPARPDAPERRRSTIREVFAAGCSVLPEPGLFAEAVPAGTERLIAVDLAANAFLPQMVRTIVSTLVAVGRQQLSPADFEQILAGADRRAAAATAPPQGLCLVRVWYSHPAANEEYDDESAEDLDPEGGRGHGPAAVASD